MCTALHIHGDAKYLAPLGVGGKGGIAMQFAVEVAKGPCPEKELQVLGVEEVVGEHLLKWVEVG